jgi:hypothetical protein
LCFAWGTLKVRWSWQLLTQDEGTTEQFQGDDEGTGAPPLNPVECEFFEAFQRGEKDSELRLYGPRWNERTCPVGRPVILSKGYGRQHRMQARILGFHRRHARTFGSTHRASIERLYGSLDVDIVEIRLEILR